MHEDTYEGSVERYVKEEPDCGFCNDRGCKMCTDTDTNKKITKQIARDLDESLY